MAISLIVSIILTLTMLSSMIAFLINGGDIMLIIFWLSSILSVLGITLTAYLYNKKKV